MRNWFILNKGIVSGPIEADQVLEHAGSSPEVLLWSRGEVEWISIEKWNHLQSLGSESPSLNDIANTESAIKIPLKKTATASPSPKNNQTKVTALNELWRLSIGMKEFPPMNYQSLLAKLREKTDFSGVSIFNSTKNEWSEVFSFEKIVEDLGISRREHDRVPIMGTFTGEHERHGAMQARVISISEGGFGLGDAKNIQIGDKIKGIINSPNLFSQISCGADVVYMSPEGMVGVSFTAIGEESRSAIIEYVRKFSALKGRS